jgi:hypothetical protein
MLITGALVLGLALGGLGIANAWSGTTNTASNATSSASQMNGASTIQALSALTGLSVQKIMTLRAGGKSFATIATENGVDPAAVVDKTVAVRQVRLDALVASGTITAEQEATTLARIRAHVEAIMNLVPRMGGIGSEVTTATPSDPTTATNRPGMRWRHDAPGAALDATGTPCANNRSVHGPNNPGRHLGWMKSKSHSRGASSTHRNDSHGMFGNSDRTAKNGNHRSGMMGSHH